MAPKTDEPAPATREDAPRRRWLLPGLLVLLALGIYAVLRPRPVDRRPLVDVFEHLTTQGYSANESLSGLYRPGDVVQVAEPTPDGGGRLLATPLLALRGDTCFPGIEPVASAFPLPAGEGRRESGFGLEGARLAKVLPGLEIGDQAAASYRLSFDPPRLLAHAKLDLSDGFDPSCVARLRRAEAAGDRLEWFETVLETVEATGLSFEVVWRSDLSSDARLSIERQAEKALGALSEGADGTAGTPDGATDELVTAAAWRVTARDERRTVLRADLPVVLGYRTRPLQFETGGDAEPTGADDPRDVFADPRANDAFAGRLAVRLRQAGGPWRRVGPGHAFIAGDRFRFEVESAKKAFLYVFHRPPGGATSELWPADSGQSNELLPGEPRQVPTPPAAFELDGQEGREIFYVALAGEAGPQEDRDETLGNYVLRGLPAEGDVRAVGITYDDDPWLYFEPAGEEYLAAVRFELRRGDAR